MFKSLNAFAIGFTCVLFSGCGDSDSGDSDGPSGPMQTTPIPTYPPCNVTGFDTENVAMFSQFKYTKDWTLDKIESCNGTMPQATPHFLTSSSSDTTETCSVMQGKKASKEVTDCLCGEGDDLKCVNLSGWQGEEKCVLWIRDKNIKTLSQRQPNGLHRVISLNCGNGRYMTSTPYVAGSEGKLNFGIKSLANVTIPAVATCENDDSKITADYRDALINACAAADKRLLCQVNAMSNATYDKNVVEVKDIANYKKDHLIDEFALENLQCGSEIMPVLPSFINAVQFSGSSLVAPGYDCNVNANTTRSVSDFCTEALLLRCSVTSDNGDTAMFFTNGAELSYPSPLFTCADGSQVVVSKKTLINPSDRMYISNTVQFESIPVCSSSEVNKFKPTLEKICKTETKLVV